VIVPSQQLAYIGHNSWKIKPSKLHYIPNGVDLGLFSTPANKTSLKSFDITSDHLVIGTVATLRPEKNIGRLIEAFSALENNFPKARLVIVGDGIGMSALKMLAERICQAERVIFVGASNTPQEFVKAFDIFALSSDTEQMPISVLEAMAAGKPIVSTNVGDISSMVSGVNSSLIEGTEAGPLATNISKLLKNDTMRAKLGLANQEKARQDFNLETMIKAYDNIFEKSARDA
jgi:glycosyltransferase involved in cell wall biosynthesis